jgi:hypothetical protein
MGWVVSATPRPLYSRRRDPVRILHGAGWAPGPVWMGCEKPDKSHPVKFFIIRPEGHKLYNVYGQKCKGKNNISIYKFSYDILTFHQQFLLQHPLSHPFHIQFMQQYFRKKTVWLKDILSVSNIRHFVLKHPVSVSTLYSVTTIKKVLWNIL